jgi:hypothetical protein
VRKKKRERALKLAPRYITHHLVSFFPTLPILALLVSKGVTAQATRELKGKKKFPFSTVRNRE